MENPIYIPTLGRERIRTLEDLPASHYPRVRLVTAPGLGRALESRYGVLAVECPEKGIAKTRQWIVDQSTSRFIMMCDDDQWFFKRIGDTVRLERLTPEETGALFDEMFDLCMIYPMVGLSARQGNNHIEDKYVRVATRVCNHYALDTEVLKKEGIRFDRMDVMEDFHVNLSLLTRGYPTVNVVDRCWNQPGSNAEGGCSSYRTAEMQADAAFALAMNFPDVVEVIKKQTKTGWFGGDRYDVKVQWKKALKQ